MKKIIILILVLIIAGVGGYYFNTLKKSSDELTRIDVDLVWLHQAQFAGFYVAKDKGFYEEEGLDVYLEEFEFGKNIEQNLITGEKDFAVLHSDQFLNSYSEGIDIKAVAAIFQKIPHALITDSLGTINRPEDLEDKILGIKGDTKSAKLLYAMLLSELGVDESNVNFKSVDFSTTELEDITNNTVDLIDIYRTDQIYLFEKNNVPYTVIPPENFGFETYGDVLVTSNEFIKQNPKITKKFVSATLKGWEYTFENPDEALDITQKYITNETYKDREYNKFILSKSLPLIKLKTGQPIGEMDFSKWKILYDAMYSNNFFENEFDLSDAYTTEFID